MSPASYLTAPPRVAATKYSRSPRRYHRGVPWWAIVCVGIFGALLLGGGALLAMSLIDVTRVSGRLQRTVDPMIRDLEVLSAELQEKSERTTDGVERLQASQTRVRASIERLQILSAALDEVRTGLRILRLVRSLL